MIKNLNILLSNNIKEDNYSQALALKNEGFILYRGNFNIGNNVVMHPQERKSAYTSNIYTCLMSEILPSWKDYPKRNHSIICSTSLDKAEQYYDGMNRIIYNILPSNNTKIAIASESDLWDSFPYMSTEMFSMKKLQLCHFNKGLLLFMSYIISMIPKTSKYYSIKYNNEIKIETIFKYNDIDTILLLFNTIEQFILNDFGEFDEGDLVPFCKNKESLLILTKFMTYLINKIKNGNTLVNILDHVFDPNLNKFTLTNINNINTKNNIFKNNEVWFDSSCLAVKMMEE